VLTQLAAAPFEANLILGLCMLGGIVGIVFGFFTNRGSGIDNHPIDGRGNAPGSKLPDEFHQFADRQVHDRDLREAAIARRAEARMMREPASLQTPHTSDDDMTLDEVNRRLAAEAEARKAAKAEQRATR
jgi:hypothetical protein